MSIEITDELLALVKDYEYYGTDANARHLADYICAELEEEE